jgi:P-type Mg2+ transporter
LPQSMQNLVFAGTHIVQGSGRGAVIAVGRNTELGKTARLMQGAQPQTEFQKGIADFGLFLFRIILIFSLAIFLFLAIFKHNWVESLLFSLAIAVGISPELLPVIITINLSRGARLMSKKQVITKRLMSIEDLGNTDILCTDKTGTLTAGNIALEDYDDFNQTKNVEILRSAILCNALSASKDIVGNSLDEAILTHAKSHHQTDLSSGYKIIDSLAFDFERRRMSVVAERKGQRRLIVKGAAEEMLKVCQQVELGGKAIALKTHLTMVRQRIQDLENQGFKLLLVAEREIEIKNRYEVGDERDLKLLGYLIFSDPLKKSVKEALETFEKLGVEIKILTGDTEAVTRHLLTEIDFKVTGVLLGPELQTLSDDELKQKVEGVNVFAKITPEHKLRIIKALGAKGHTVSFLGDGVNDAPALRVADVGISVDSAVDIAKEAADIILMQKNLNVLSEGIIEGRKTFNNTLKYIYCTISSNYGNMFSVAGAALILPFIPMLPAQILLLNFLSDLPMLAIAADRNDEEDLRKPKHWNIKIVSKFMAYFGLISSVFDFLTFGFLIYIFGHVAPIFQAGWFWESFLTEVILIFVIRTKRLFWRSKPGKALVLTTAVTALLVLIFLYSPLRNYFGFARLPVRSLLIIIVIAAAYFSVVELGKKMFYKRFKI